MGSQTRVVGQYEVLEEISHRGMARVFRARQLSVDRLVVLKQVALDLESEAILRGLKLVIQNVQD